MWITSFHVTAEGHEWEDEPVEVVIDIEVAGKARTGEPRLLPGTVFTLGLYEIGDPATG
jgi:hypothetical protein